MKELQIRSFHKALAPLPAGGPGDARHLSSRWWCSRWGPTYLRLRRRSWLLLECYNRQIQDALQYAAGLCIKVCTFGGRSKAYRNIMRSLVSQWGSELQPCPEDPNSERVKAFMSLNNRKVVRCCRRRETHSRYFARSPNEYTNVVYIHRS